MKDEVEQTAIKGFTSELEREIADKLGLLIKMVENQMGKALKIGDDRIPGIRFIVYLLFIQLHLNRHSRI